MPTTDTYILGLDVGDKRVGAALASPVARIASPYGVYENNAGIWEALSRLIATEHVGVVVVGLPRSLNGEETAQTKIARHFARTLEETVGLPIVMQDEALTSRQAEAELRSRGRNFSKGDIDALAATYILEDYLRNYSAEEKKRGSE